jgi:hypothetical protein
MRRPMPGQLLAGWLHYDGRYVMEPHPHVEPDRILISGSSNDLQNPNPPGSWRPMNTHQLTLDTTTRQLSTQVPLESVAPASSNRHNG